MRVLAIDYGTKRVGLALSDAEGRLAFPHGTLPNDRALVSSVLELIREKNVKVVVMGESRAQDGTSNPVMEPARRFAADLEREGNVTVLFEPEFYTSYEARRLTEKSLVDAEAAAIILKSYLERTHTYADND